MLVEGVHFRREWSSPGDIGAKAVLVNVSDLDAMGAEPRVATLSLALPAISGTPPEFGWHAPWSRAVDGLPFIGPHRNYPHHLFALGLGTNPGENYGMQLFEQFAIANNAWPFDEAGNVTMNTPEMIEAGDPSVAPSIAKAVEKIAEYAGVPLPKDEYHGKVQPFALRKAASFAKGSRRLPPSPSMTCSARSASATSSSVARNAATSACGSRSMKPTVSESSSSR